MESFAKNQLYSRQCLLLVQTLALLALAPATAVSNTIHIAYASDLSHSQVAVMNQSMASIVSYASKETESRLQFHIFYQGARRYSGPPFFVKDADIQPIDASLIGDFKVWGLHEKLKNSANFYRFYIPKILRDRFAAHRMLYLDTDTLVGGDIAELFDVPFPGNITMGMGVQSKKVCWFSKILHLNEPVLAKFHFSPDALCPTASVLLIDIDRWIQADMTAQVEFYMKENMKTRLWELGSMPPLMVVAELAGWVQLRAVWDTKGVIVTSPEIIKQNGYILAHPAKVIVKTDNAMHAPLKILAVGTACDTTDCRLGGVRIWHGNYVNAMRRIGNQVKTIHQLHEDPSTIQEDVVMWSHCPPLTLAATKAIVLIMKPNGCSVDILNTFHPVFGAILHSESEALNGMKTRDLVPAVKHIEVPRKYWANSTGTESIYPYVAVHKPYEFAFSASRPAKVCYHGSHSHILENYHFIADLMRMKKELPIEIITYTSEKHLLLKNAVLREVLTVNDFTTMDDLFLRLAECDLGLVPQYQREPEMRSSNQIYPVLTYFYKNSANGGRAYVFAQVGVPMVGHSEPEFVELMGGAHVDLNDVIVVSSWFDKVEKFVLQTSVSEKITMASALRTYAENYLDIFKEAKKIDKHVRKLIAAKKIS